MCKYCCSVGDGDKYSEQKEIIDIEVPAFMDKLLFTIDISPEREIWLAGGHKNGYLDTLAKAKIKYCPMCGRKL